MAVSQSQLDIIIRAIAENKGLTQINADLDKLKKTTDQADQATNKFGSGVIKLQSVLAGLGLAVTAQQAFDFAVASVQAYRESEQAAAQLDAVLKSTGEAAGVTADQAQKLAEAYQKTTLFTDEAVLSGESLLLTFTKIGKDVFPQATQIMLDMSQAMGQDIKSSAIQLGKALNDPIEGMSALTRVGVTFSDEQERMIDKLQRSGDLAGAQKIILDELNTEFGGSAEAARDAAGGWTDASMALGNFQEAFGGVLNALGESQLGEAVTAGLDRLTEGAQAWTNILNEQIPLIQQHESAMAANAAQVVINSQSYDEIAAAVNEAENDSEAFRQSLLQSVGTHQEYQAAVDKVAQSNIFLAGELDLTGEEFDQLKAQISEAALVSDVWVSSARAMDIAASNAAISVQKLADAQQQASLTNREDAAMREYYTAMGQTAEIEANFEKQQFIQTGEEKRRLRQQEQREAEQAAKASERQAKQQAQTITEAFSEVGNQISSAVSSAVSQSSTDIAGLLGFNAEGEQRVNEGVRRMAAVATGGLANEWTQQLASQLQGVSAADAFVKAVSGGNDAAVREEARKLATNPIVELFDAQMIATQIEQQMRAQQLQQVLNDKVNALLGEKGLPAVQQITQQVGTVATDVGAATAAAGESAAGLATNSEAAAERMSKTYDGAITKIEVVNRLIRETIGLTERWGEVTQSAVDKFNSVGPGAATQPNGAPSNASKKMGGPSPL